MSRAYLHVFDPDTGFPGTGLPVEVKRTVCFGFYALVCYDTLAGAWAQGATEFSRIIDRICSIPRGLEDCTIALIVGINRF